MSNTAIFGKNNEFFAVVGAITACYVVFSVVWSIWSGLKAFVLGRTLGLNTDLRKTGQWAGEHHSEACGSRSINGRSTLPVVVALMGPGQVVRPPVGADRESTSPLTRKKRPTQMSWGCHPRKDEIYPPLKDLGSRDTLRCHWREMPLENTTTTPVAFAAADSSFGLKYQCS